MPAMGPMAVMPRRSSESGRAPCSRVGALVAALAAAAARSASVMVVGKRHAAACVVVVRALQVWWQGSEGCLLL